MPENFIKFKAYPGLATKSFPKCTEKILFCDFSLDDLLVRSAFENFFVCPKPLCMT